MTRTPEDTALAFAHVARNLLEQGSVQSTLEEIADLAVAEVKGCEFAGISVVQKDGSIMTPAATDPLVGRADQLQHSTRQGPCLEAIRARDVYIIGDMSQETRWPDFAGKALQLGMNSMLSHQLYTRREVLGGLNLYSTEPNAFDAESTQIGQVLAAHAAVALASAQNEAHLHDAIRTRERIGEATGILMERHKLSREQAFSLLSKASQNLNTKLRDLAEEVVHTGTIPAGTDSPKKHR